MIGWLDFSDMHLKCSYIPFWVGFTKKGVTTIIASMSLIWLISSTCSKIVSVEEDPSPTMIGTFFSTILIVSFTRLIFSFFRREEDSPVVPDTTTPLIPDSISHEIYFEYDSMSRAPFLKGETTAAK